jgi:hypothetical protein
MRSLLTSGTRGSRTIVTLFASAAVLAGAAMLARPAAAAPPTRIDFASSGSFTLDAGTLCSFAVDVSYTQQGTTTGFFDDDGVLTKRITDGTEQDTFSANGKTLVGDTYHFTFVSEFENGVRVDYHENGVAERVPLPDGGIFIVAGRVDVLASGGGFILSVDSGNSGNNLEAFCAALS